MKINKYFLFTMILLISCSTFSEKNLVTNVKTNPNNSKYIYELYKYYERNALLSDQLLTMWRYLIITDNKLKAKRLLNEFNNRLYKTPQGMEKETIYLNPENLKDDRNFNLTMEILFGLEKNKLSKENNQSKSVMVKNLEFFNSYLKLVSDLYKKKVKNNYNNNFTVTYLMPYYVEIVDNNYIEPFVYKIFSSYDTDEINTWVKNNDSRMQEFLNWSENYNWNKNSQ